MDDLRRELGRLETTLARADAPKTRVIDELSSMRQELACGTKAPAKFQLANVRVGSPCKERWADMVGDERVRVCNGCDRPVFNLSEMTRADAEAVLATRGITPCVRFYRRTDGTVMTTDCPPGARRSRRLAVVASTVAAGSALLAPSVAGAEPDPTPDAVTPAAPDPDVASDAVLKATTDVETYEVTMGVMIVEPHPEHTTLEWSTWARGEVGMASQVPTAAARSTTMEPGLPTSSTVTEGALGADLSVSVAQRGEIRIGAWTEMRSSSVPPVLGGELIVGGFPPHPHAFDFDGGGNVVLRVGANAHVLTTALGFGYSGTWSRSEPWISSVQHVGGVRLIASMNRSLDKPGEWSATLGLEVDPITAARWFVDLIADD